METTNPLFVPELFCKIATYFNRHCWQKVRLLCSVTASFFVAYCRTINPVFRRVLGLPVDEEDSVRGYARPYTGKERRAYFDLALAEVRRSRPERRLALISEMNFNGLSTGEFTKLLYKPLHEAAQELKDSPYADAIVAQMNDFLLRDLLEYGIHSVNEEVLRRAKRRRAPKSVADAARRLASRKQCCAECKFLTTLNSRGPDWLPDATEAMLAMPCSHSALDTWLSIATGRVAIAHYILESPETREYIRYLNSRRPGAISCRLHGPECAQLP